MRRKITYIYDRPDWPTFRWDAATLVKPLGAVRHRQGVLLVSHAPALIDALDEAADCTRVVLEKRFGETVVRDGDDPPPWTWPSR